MIYLSLLAGMRMGVWVFPVDIYIYSFLYKHGLAHATLLHIVGIWMMLLEWLTYTFRLRSIATRVL